MKKCRNRKGISLVEVLIYLALISVFTPMIMSAFMYGFESYRTNNNLIEQEKKVNSVIQKIRNDVQKCDAVTVNGKKEIQLAFYNVSTKADTTVIWTFEDGSLKRDSEVLVEGIDVAKSEFEDAVAVERLRVTVQPRITNNLSKYENRNILKPIITEFSVKYKR